MNICNQLNKQMNYQLCCLHNFYNKPTGIAVAHGTIPLSYQAFKRKDTIVIYKMGSSNYPKQQNGIN